MKVSQIATLLNETFDEIIGESAVVSEDLSNIVSAGNEITSSTQWGENFDNYVKTIIDKVGQTIFWARDYVADMPPIIRDSWEYGSILEKIRADVGDYEESKMWQLTSDTVFDVFSFVPPTVNAKYFNLLTTFTLKISITRKQAESAFKSASDMNSFISMIENRINMKLKIAMKALAMRTVVNLIAEKVKSNNNVVNLLSLYKTASGDSTITAETAFTNRDFLRFAAGTIMKYQEYLKDASMLFNDAGYVTFTPKERQKFFVISDLDVALKTVLLSDTYHENFVSLNGYYSLPYWQGSGTDNEFTERSKIYAIPASEGEAPSGEDTRTPVQKSGIVAVLFDEWAAMVCNQSPEVSSIYNPEGRFWNYWHTFDASYYNDLAENCVVFTIEDENEDENA